QLAARDRGAVEIDAGAGTRGQDQAGRPVRHSPAEEDVAARHRLERTGIVNSAPGRKIPPLIFSVMTAVPPLEIVPDDGATIADVALGRMLSMVRCRFLAAAGSVGLTALPAPSVIEAPLTRLSPLIVRSVVFWPLPTV